jgi:hypothetical protein
MMPRGNSLVQRAQLEGSTRANPEKGGYEREWGLPCIAGAITLIGVIMLMDMGNNRN